MVESLSFMWKIFAAPGYVAWIDKIIITYFYDLMNSLKTWNFGSGDSSSKYCSENNSKSSFGEYF